MRGKSQKCELLLLYLLYYVLCIIIVQSENHKEKERKIKQNANVLNSTRQKL